ncbi:pairing protein 2 family protein [Achlya hypogyna]|uniref:Homologous-pairing protein 2 homolog n=1 Tax=Achlya hypogyna TaxID=1202772 RepID=A0A1V9ZG93_ACHHY|nr:pairing protein 2 family protein [Achlya hypogyna]
MGKNDSSSEDDFQLESEDDDFELTPVSLKAKSPASAKATASKRKQECDSDGDDFEQIKKPKVVKKPSSAPSKSEKPVVEKKPAGKKEAAPKEPEKPKELVSQSQAEGEVVKYMRQTNRPYSVLNVFENLHRRIGKVMLQKILDALAEKGDIKVKTYGKSQIYYYNQEKLPPPCAATLARTEEAIEAVSGEVQELERALKEAESILHGLSNQMTDAELTQQLSEHTAQAETLSAAVTRLDDPTRAPVAPEKKKAATAKFTTYRMGWIKRKRIVMEAVDQIAEGMEKKRKDVLDLVGVETDESAGIKELPAL